MSVFALTGATGFVGKRTVAAAVDAGHRVRALARRPQPETAGVAWIEGSLEQPESLVRLAAGADAVIHIAGVVNVPTRAGFVRGNVGGTAAMIAAARMAGVARFVHVSSLAAREPQLSHYGYSKERAEAAVTESGLDWTIVRPPAIYGPGDLEMRDMFRMAKLGLALLPPPGRLSVIHVDDLATLLLALATSDSGRVILEADDGRTGGWSHDGFARAIGTAVGRHIVSLPLPRALLALGARIDRLARGEHAKLTPDRVAYFCHPDWTIDPARRPDPARWQPGMATDRGLAETAAWYRAHGLL